MGNVLLGEVRKEIFLSKGSRTKTSAKVSSPEHYILAGPLTPMSCCFLNCFSGAASSCLVMILIFGNTKKNLESKLLNLVGEPAG